MSGRGQTPIISFHNKGIIGVCPRIPRKNDAGVMDEDAGVRKGEAGVWGGKSSRMKEVAGATSPHSPATFRGNSLFFNRLCRAWRETPSSWAALFWLFWVELRATSTA